MVQRALRRCVGGITAALLLCSTFEAMGQSGSIEKEAFTTESSKLSIPTYSIFKSNVLLVPHDAANQPLQFFFVPVTAELPTEVPLGSTFTFVKNPKRLATDPLTYRLGINMGDESQTNILVKPVENLFKTETSAIGTMLSPNTTNSKLPKITGPILVLATQPGFNEVRNLFITQQENTKIPNSLSVGLQPVIPINLADQNSFPRVTEALSNTKLSESLSRIFTQASTPSLSSKSPRTFAASTEDAFNSSVTTINSLLKQETLGPTLSPLINRFIDDARALATTPSKDAASVLKLEREMQVLNQWILTGRVLEVSTSNEPPANAPSNAASQPSASNGPSGSASNSANPSAGSQNGSTTSPPGINAGGAGASGPGAISGGGQSTGGQQPATGGGTGSPVTGGGAQNPGGGSSTNANIPPAGNYPSEPACPNFGVSVKKINGQPGDPVRSVTLTWKSALNTYDYKVRFLERTTKSTYIFPFVGAMVDYTTAPLPTGIYDVWVSERSRSGGIYKEQCAPTEVKFPFECPAFREPGVVKKGNGEIQLSNLRDSGTLWFELIALKSGAKLPNLGANEQGVFQNPQTKACYEASKYGTISSPVTPFGARVKKDGRFSTNDPIIVQSPSSGGAFLVCLYLCPSCMPQATLEGRPDAFVRAFMWQGDTEGDNSSLSAFSPSANAQISNTLRPTIAFNPSRNATGYEVEIRNSLNGAIVALGKGLTVPEFTPTDRLAPGQYTAASRTFFKGIGGNFTDRVPFTVSIPTVTTLTPRGSGAGLEPTLRWQPSEHTDATYEVRIDDVTSVPKTLFTQPGLTSTSLETPGTLTPGKKYVWFVRAKVGPYVGDWGEGESFTIPSQVTTLDAPLKETAGLQPFLFWSPVPGGPKDKVAYEIRGDYVRGQTVVGNAFNAATTDTLFQPTKELRSGSTLQIKIRAIVNGIPLAWGKAVTLQVTKGGG